MAAKRSAEERGETAADEAAKRVAYLEQRKQLLVQLQARKLAAAAAQRELLEKEALETEKKPDSTQVALLNFHYKLSLFLPLLCVRFLHVQRTKGNAERGAAGGDSAALILLQRGASLQVLYASVIIQGPRSPCVGLGEEA